MGSGLFFLFAGGLLLLLSWWGFHRSGLPDGIPVYVDRGKLEPGAALFDPEGNLSGRPDYILRHHRSWIPVELKTGATPPQPFESHILQLAAYMRLIEVENGHRPPYGFILYPRGNFRVPNSRNLKKKLGQTLSRIRMVTNSLPNRSHTKADRCRACGFRAICDQALEA